MRFTRCVPFMVLAAVALVVPGCRDTTTIVQIQDPVAAHLTLVAGDNQSVPLGGFAEIPLTVRVTSGEDFPVKDVTVFYRIASGQFSPLGSGLSTVTQTDGNGIAFIKLPASNVPDSIVVEAIAYTLVESPVRFHITIGPEYQYVSATELGEVALDISLVNVGDVFGGYINELTLDGSRLYVPPGTYGGGFLIFDVGDPAHPALLGTPSDVDSRDVAVAAGRAYSVSGNRLDIVDVGDPTQPRKLGSLDVGGSLGAAATTVAIGGTVAYVTGGGPSLGSAAALTAIDVSNPASPHNLDSSAEQGGSDVAVSGTLAAVTCFGEGLRLYDIANPADLHLAGSLGLPGSAIRVVLANSRAYVLSVANGLTLTTVDISNTAQPHVLDAVTIPTILAGSSYSGSVRSYLGLTVAAGVAYVGSYNGVIVIRPQEGGQGRILGRIGPRGFIGGIAVVGSTVIAGATSELHSLAPHFKPGA